MTRRIEIPATQLPASRAQATLQIVEKSVALLNAEATFVLLPDNPLQESAQ